MKFFQLSLFHWFESIKPKEVVVENKFKRKRVTEKQLKIWSEVRKKRQRLING